MPEIAREMEWLAMGLVGKTSPEALGSKGQFCVSCPLFGELTPLSSWVPHSSQHCCSGPRGTAGVQTMETLWNANH